MSEMAGDKATIRDCGYSGQILDFVYDELAGSAKMAFEGHLSQCSSCTEDVADLSSTSMAVRHWRAVEFDPLGALGFELPRGLEARPSLAASILAFFRQPLYAAAVATLLIGAAVGLYVLLGSPTRSQPAIATTDSPARVGSLVPKPILPVDEPETRVERDADEQIAATERLIFASLSPSDKEISAFLFSSAVFCFSIASVTDFGGVRLRISYLLTLTPQGSEA